MTKQIVAFVVSVVIACLPALMSNLTGGSAWYDDLDKPPLNPPGAVFGPVWGVLYVLTGVALYLIWRSESGNKQKAYTLFGIQLVLNAAWTGGFFGAEKPWLAVAIILALLVTIIVCIIQFRTVSQWASWLFIPYALWVAFATYLNVGVAVLN